MKEIHGGDIYRNSVTLDFSVNVNPLGIPEPVTKALQEAVKKCQEYPDIRAERLTREVSKLVGVPGEYLAFGNGASELFMAIVHGLKPKKTVIPVPSFYGYEYAANAEEQEIVYHMLKEENEFGLSEDLLDQLTEEVDMLFLANPNNPTGRLTDKSFLQKLLKHCERSEIFVVLDECFIEFCGEEFSMIKEAAEYNNLILVRAFTKIFSIPGVRLGYLVCSNQELLGKIRRQLPEWNLSCFAQAAGCACAGERDYLEKTADYVKEERQFLTENLKKIGWKVFPGSANFLLFYSDKPIYEALLAKGILIRDCSNFRGLGKGFYRIAVKNRQENEKLIKEMGELK